MNEKYDKCIQFVLKHEGGYVNDPVDPGGETNFGISHKSYPDENIKNMTIDRAKEIYFRDYWTPLNCENYSDKTALSILDSGVNCGTGTVKKWVSEIIDEITVEKILFKRLRRYADLCQKNPKLLKFLLGWLIRVLHVWEQG